MKSKPYYTRDYKSIGISKLMELLPSPERPFEFYIHIKIKRDVCAEVFQKGIEVGKFRFKMPTNETWKMQWWYETLEEIQEQYFDDKPPRVVGLLEYFRGKRARFILMSSENFDLYYIE